MKPTEFRIGNYLISKRDDAVLFVDEINQSDIVTIVLDRSKYPLPMGWEAEPIELTDEWLEKLGFEKKWESNGAYYIWEKPGVEFGIYLNKHSEYWFEDYSSGLEIKYVHQLQNLYFALTEGELTLKQ